MVDKPTNKLDTTIQRYFDDNYNGPTFNNAQEFVHSLFGSKSTLKVGALRIVPIKKGYRIEVDARRKEPKKKIGKST